MSRAGTRSEDEHARLRIRVAVLERRVDELAARLLRAEGRDRRVLRAKPGDGRARKHAPEPPACPGCATTVRPDAERCPLCGCIFTALPRGARPSAQVPGRRRKGSGR